MKEDEIIEMARQAGMMSEVLQLGRNLELLTDFAKLVAKHTLMNIDPSKFISWQEGFEAGRFAEREACAKLCDAMEEKAEGMECCKWPTPIDCAEAIRNRGQA